MQDNQMKILRIFAEKIRQKYPQARIWAFGSYARGRSTAESDLDICVVLPQMDPEDRISVSDTAWEVGLEHDLHISTIVISEKDFEQGPASASLLLDSIRNEGIVA